MTKRIRISDDSYVLVDAEDYEWLIKWRWSANGNGYAVRGKHIGNRKYQKIYMHREIAKAEKGEQVDHINGDKSDNRKENLRTASHADNSRNIGLRKNNTSGYKGVIFDRGRRKWRAEIKVNYENIHLGMFDCKIEAAKKYNEAAIKYHGDFANLNKIKGEDAS